MNEDDIKRVRAFFDALSTKISTNINTITTIGVDPTGAVNFLCNVSLLADIIEEVIIEEIEKEGK